MKKTNRIVTHIIIGAAAVTIAQAQPPEVKAIGYIAAGLATLSTLGELTRPSNP